MNKIFGFFKNKETLFLIFLLFFAFLYRLWFASLAYPDIIFDMDRYVGFAYQILDGKIVADCCDKNAGYPMFIAAVLAYFGRENINAVRFIQIILDTLSILLMYVIAAKTYHKTSAQISSFVYAFNPFTASYTGLILPEVLSIFLLFLLLIVVINKFFNSSKVLWVMTGFLMGILVFVRIQFSVVMALSIIAITLSFFKGNKRVLFVLMCAIGFLFASSYSLYSYYSNFGKISIVPPYTNTGGQAYIYSQQSDPFPELLLQGQTYNQLFYQVGAEWFGSDISLRESINKKNQKLFFERLITSFPEVMGHYVQNMYRIWSRDHLFYYVDIWYPKDRVEVFILNFSYMGLGIFGFFMYLKKSGRNSLASPVILIFVSVLLGTTFLYTFLSNEPRHSLPAFGVIILWAGYGISNILRYLLKRI